MKNKKTEIQPDYEFPVDLWDEGLKKHINCNISIDGGYITISVQDLPDVCVEIYNGEIKIHKE